MRLDELQVGDTFRAVGLDPSRYTGELLGLSSSRARVRWYRTKTEQFPTHAGEEVVFDRRYVDADCALSCEVEPVSVPKVKARKDKKQDET